MSRTVTMKGSPLPVEGPELKVGDTAPDFRLHSSTPDGLRDVTLSDFDGKTLVLSVVPSLDTSVCATMTKRIADEFLALPDNIEILTVSTDLPFAQTRFCNENGITRTKTASDHRDVSFGRAYGVLIPALRILARAVFVIDANKRITHVEYVPELAQEPDYEALLAAANQAALIG